MLGDIAAPLFIVGFLTKATSTADAGFAPLSLWLAGLACLALHRIGAGTSWPVPLAPGPPRSRPAPDPAAVPHPIPSHVIAGRQL
jgi:hypothetical protein